MREEITQDNQETVAVDFLWQFILNHGKKEYSIIFQIIDNHPEITITGDCPYEKMREYNLLDMFNRLNGQAYIGDWVEDHLWGYALGQAHLGITLAKHYSRIEEESMGKIIH